MLTREDIAKGRTLLQESFEGPWRYKQFEIECGACVSLRDQDTDEVSCANPECNGEDVPCTFIEAPEAYPRYPDSPQVVATIDVPGLSCLAEKNGEAICWLRNNATELLEANEGLRELLECLAWLSSTDKHLPPPAMENALSVLDYAKSLGWRP